MELQKKDMYEFELGAGTPVRVTYANDGLYDLILGEERISGDYKELGKLAEHLLKIYEDIQLAESNKELTLGDGEL